ncbi:hypothetical protein [Novosphingobium sp. MMS21-SN21R]|uniref:hypothetical protein n=1 Tax=Novosphingobium sp. MMS21-SN21R TaxID=2969298 RepID=UPI00288866E7|nr:hypothetical protein [Novosphingobium sp. MMS21-SN21R]MDT0508445.1 hypothetical protein [Novosphingobium sp. MMS21-SN21R]
MTPNVDERLASIIRSLSEVVLPHLPPEASLAQEQVHLCIGHLQILRAQIDHVPAFEQEELGDAVSIARELIGSTTGGEATSAAIESLRNAADAAGSGHMRQDRKQVLEAVDALIKAVASDGSAQAKADLSDIILRHETERSLKDRRWFAPFGFDTV